MKRISLIIYLLTISTIGSSNNFELFHESIKKLEHIGYEDSDIKQNYIKLISILSDNFDLQLDVQTEKNKILITGEGFKTKFNNIISSKSKSLLTRIKPAIEKKLRSYNLTIGYEEYLCDFFISLMDPESQFYYDFRKQYEIFNCRTDLHVARNITTHDLLIRHIELRGDDAHLIEKGDTILSINSIPASIIPNGLCSYLIKSDDIKIEVKRMNEVISTDLICNQEEQMTNFSIDDSMNDYLIIKFHSLDYDFSKKFIDSLSAYPDRTKKLVLDLTQCGGGLFREVIKFADCFLEPEKEVVKLAPITNSSIEEKTYYTQEDVKTNRTIHSVLISSETASGAEVIVGVLKHYYLADNIVGQETMGYGPVQKTYRYLLDNNIGCRLSLAYMTLPNGQSIHKSAIKPTIADSSLRK